MSFIIDKLLCSGCGACVSICPQKSLILSSDEEGFLYPHIVNDKCVNCGLCETVCPSITPFSKRDPKKAIAVRHKNVLVRKTSSSGGVFSAFATYVISKGGVVCGAAFDDNYEVHHICINKASDIELLKGSKYVQSRMENCFSEIKNYLEKDKTVLFVGTPCQVAGLNGFLRNEDTRRLLSIELCCHAVPSPLIWRRYLKNKFVRPENIEYVSFRSKANGVKNYSLEIKTSIGQHFIEEKSENIYMRGFLENLFCRPICAKCVFRQFATNSDVSIGDFWGIEKYYPLKDDALGCNQVLIHTEKGFDFFERISLDEYDVFPITIGEAFMGNTNYINSCPAHINRNMFWDMFARGINVDEAIISSLNHSKHNELRRSLKMLIKNVICRKLH